ncbi:MAG: hypothetical protein QM621_00610 [Aeromicrobium sp.]|uniref:hypothetical protein n=1 Tax=Aeromicrobium sp. TaxID=1871063 RepID=UPI0039E45DF0
MSNTYTDINGVTFTDADIERWGAEADAGFPDDEFTRATPTWITSESMETHSVRVPPALWELVIENAKRRGISTSQYAREALARGLAS